MIVYTFHLEGKVVPYTRRTFKGKYSDAAKRYHASQNAIGWQYKIQLREFDWPMMPTQTPLFLEVDYQVPERIHTFDFDNVLKALSDAAQGIVFKNDLWVDELHATRRLGSDYRATISIGTKGDK